MRRVGWGATYAVLVLLAAACSTPSVPIKSGPTRDVVEGRALALDSAGILLSYAAYDYALVGALNGEKIRAIAPERYATIARTQAAAVSALSSKTVTATVSTAGPIHDRVVTLADGLSDLSRDALAYAGAGDAAAFSRVIAGVDHGWSLLRDLASVLPDDPQLGAVIARGTAMRASATMSQRFVVTVGPFASAGEAADAARKIGANAVAAKESPFVVRVGPYADRPSADDVAAALAKQQLLTVVTAETVYTFARSGTAPDVELWREPERYIDTHAQARRISLSHDGYLVATGSDDSYVAIFTNDGILRSLPTGNAGVNTLVFTDDGRFLMGGGQMLVTWMMPLPTYSLGIGTPMRLTNAAQSAVYVPTANAFAAASQGLGGGTGIIGGRAPDGVPLGPPFPIEVGPEGAYLAASDAGDLFVAAQVAAGFQVHVFRVGVERFPKGVLTIPGTGRAFAIARGGGLGAAVTDKATYRFVPNAPDPTKTLVELTAPVRDLEFAADGTLYLLDQRRLVAVGPDGATLWTAPLVDGRRLAVGRRPVVLDGTDRLLVFDPKTGAADELAPVDQIQDLTVSRDGRWIGVIAEARRAVLFRLP